MYHKISTDIHLGAYVQSGDPGAVGAKMLWIDTSLARPLWKKRNAGDTGWDLIGDQNPMSQQGDMIFGGALGVQTRVPTGVDSQLLIEVQQSALIANPTTAPTMGAASGASTFAVTTTYYVVYAWQNVNGQTLATTPAISFTTGNPALAQPVTAPAAPAGTTNLLTFLGTVLGGPFYLANTLASPSTGGTNTITLSAPPNTALAVPVTVNTTGGVTPTWSSVAPAGGSTGTSGVARFIGKVVSGGPAIGTWLVDDIGVDASGVLWVCTTAGTPGTWRPVYFHLSSSTSPALATSGTITTSGVSIARVTPAAAVTGVILQAGTYDGQEVWVVNEGLAASSITFAAAGTSNVADGTGTALAGLTGRQFKWVTTTSLWSRAA